MLISFSTNKLNLCLVKALQYCFQFHIDVQHHSDQLNTILNTLSCFLNKITDSKNQSLKNILKNIDKKIHIYHIIVIKMSFNFQNKIKKIIQQLHYFKESLAKMFLYFYFMNKNLVYYFDFVDI